MFTPAVMIFTDVAAAMAGTAAKMVAVITALTAVAVFASMVGENLAAVMTAVVAEVAALMTAMLG